MPASRCLRRIVLSAVLLGLGPAAPRLARAQTAAPIDPQAQARFKRGLEHFKTREFEAALTEFEAAYAIDPRPEILFSMAQAERLSGDCASAVVLYRQFLADDPPAVHAEAARTSLEKCEIALGSKRQGGGEPSGPPADETRAPSAPPVAEALPEPAVAPREAPPGPRRARRPFYLDPVGDTLAGTGLVALGIGVGFYVMSANDASAAADATRYSDHVSLLDRAEERRTIAWIGVGVGSALLAGAAVRWMWPEAGAERAPQVGVSWSGPGAGGAALVVSGGF